MGGKVQGPADEPGADEPLTWGWMEETLLARGLEPYADSEGRVRLRGPRGAATPALVQALRLFEAELRHLADAGAPRRVVVADTPEVISQWAPAPGVTDVGRLMRAAARRPGVKLFLQTYTQLGEGGEWQWRTFATVGGAEGGALP